MKIKCLSLVSLVLVSCLTGRADTTITISTNVQVAAAKRLGLNIGFHAYYDSRLMMKELCFRNPGFEGQIYQSVLRVSAGTPTNCVDDLTFGGWTNGFWDGAAFEFIWGAAKGRGGIVTNYQRPTGGSGSRFGFDATGSAPAAGDYFVVRKSFIGAPETGWWLNGSNYVVAAERTDLATNTLGYQALRARSTNVTANFNLACNLDVYPGISFIQLQGRHRISFRAKSLGGALPLSVMVVRGGPPAVTYLNTNVAVTSAWADYAVEFIGTESGSARGTIALQLRVSGSFDVLLDDVSFAPVDGDPANPTAFRDPVVNAIKACRPGIIRSGQEHLGESLDTLIAPLLSRPRAGYSIYSTAQQNLQFGWHEFLELCEHVGAEPWLSFPTVFSMQEMTNAIEYLAGSTNTVYGARRAARGHPAPWTDSFARIHLEHGNEQWNGGNYFGGAMVMSTPQANRAHELFGAAKAAAGALTNKFDFVLGAHSVETIRNLNTHNASTNHDSLTVDGYLAYRWDNYGSNEELFQPLFAQAEQYDRAGHMLANYQNLQASSHPVPLSIYEVNLHTTTGAITNSQAALDAFTPSVGAALGVGNHMLMMLRDLRARDQCLFNFGGYTTSIGSGSRIWAVVVDAGVTDRKRPTFYMLQLANDAIGDGADVLQTTHTGDDPTWSQTGVNSVTLTNAHQLWSYAFAGASNRSLVLFNLSLSNALPVNFAGLGAPTGSVTLKQLTSARITDNNEFSNVVGVVTQAVSNFNPAAPLALPPFSMTLLTWANGTNNAAETNVVVAPVIEIPPQSQTVSTGATISFSATVSGTEPLFFQWWKDANTLVGATNRSHSISNVQAADAGGYFLVVSNAAGFATSSIATLTVTQAPPVGLSIVIQPQSISQVISFPAWFSVVATGTPPFTYQWRRGGTNQSGAVGPTFGWSAVHPGLVGTYDVVVANASGSVTSTPVTLSVVANTASCALTNLRLTPLNELGLGTHKGYGGGLYPGGLNSRPPAHEAAGRAIARTNILPRNAAGAPDTNNGRIALLSIGMSNTTQEWAVGANDGTNDFTVAFRYRATNDPSRNPRLVIVDAAQGGNDAPLWTNAAMGAWTNVQNRLSAAGVTSNQVQVIWIKQAIAGQLSLGAFPTHAQIFQSQLELIIRAAKSRFPNLQIVYLSSRTRSYAADNSLNPEPAAYEGGFSVKWLIEKQLNGQFNYDPARGPVEAPWLAWGPYLWADGLVPRADGFTWSCSDLRSDFTHPSQSGVRKVSEQLLNFFKTDPTATPWFLRTNIVGQAPVCAPVASMTNGPLPLLVNFTAHATDPDGSIMEHRWTYDDGDFSTNANPVKLFTAPGFHTARLTVTDNSGNTATGSVGIHVTMTAEQWRQARFTAAEWANPGLSGDGADYEGDGLTNALEFALGLDPKTTNGPGTGMPRAEIVGGHFTLVFTRSKVAEDASVVVEFSDDLQNWHGSEGWIEETILNDTGLVETVSARQSAPASGGGQGFIRLRLLRP